MAGEKAYLDKAIARYPPEVAAIARAALKKLREHFAGARLSVYDRRQSLPIAIGPADGSAAVFSLVLYPRWVRFFFVEGAILDDPETRLEGKGSQFRSIRLDPNAAMLDDHYIRKLLAQALKVAGTDLKSGRGSIVLKSTVASARGGREPARPRK